MVEEKNPHPVNEDPEKHLGQPLTDPWIESGVDWSSVESQIEDEKDFAEDDEV